MDSEPCGIRIPYAVQNADCGGKGLFTLSHVSTGDLIWKFVEGENVIMYDGEAATAYLSNLTPAEAKAFLDATYGLKDKLCSISDDGTFMNHSTSPNCVTDMETGCTYALRDINPGEQLFEDYATFEHPVFLLPLLEKYNCAPDYYDLPDPK